MIEKPLPLPTTDSEPYWRGALHDELLLQKCVTCSNYRFFPRHLCPFCGSVDFEWQAAAGTGTVYAVTVVHRAPSKSFIADCPYVVALIELDEGPRMMSNVVGSPPEAVKIGQRVHVVFDHIADDVALPKFQLENN